MSEKKKIAAPMIIVPNILVTAKPTASRINGLRMEPRIPLSNKGRLTHRHRFFSPYLLDDETIRIIARYKTAIPKTTQ